MLAFRKKILFNNCNKYCGYEDCVDEEKPKNFASEIKKKENQDSLKLSDRYLTLEISLEKPAMSLMNFERRWEEWGDFYADEIRNRCGKLFHSQFECYEHREWGGFFKMQRQELNRYAEIIRQHIEKKLFDE